MEEHIFNNFRLLDLIVYTDGIQISLGANVKSFDAITLKNPLRLRIMKSQLVVIN